MNIEYKSNKEFDAGVLQDLFLSVNWDSGNYPEKLKAALANSDEVFSAWDGDKLIGLINALSDGVMTAYFHYLLIRPEYQGNGVGKKLLDMMLDKYSSCARKVLISYNDTIEFYKKCGFTESKHSVPMFVTYLKT